MFIDKLRQKVKTDIQTILIRGGNMTHFICRIFVLLCRHFAFSPQKYKNTKIRQNSAFSYFCVCWRKSATIEKSSFK